MSIISTVPKGAAVEGINPNLLRNWYFVGGGTGRGVFPVNSRGATSYAWAGGDYRYAMDGWRGAYPQIDLTLISSGLQITYVNTSQGGNLDQQINLVSGLTYTASALTSLGLLTSTATVSSTISSGNPSLSTTKFRVHFSPAQLNCIVYAVKVELGDQQTLCHQENGVWVLNEIPNYEEELIKCQTSTADSTDTYANKTLATGQELAYIETGTTASVQHEVGSRFCWNGLLYRTTVTINANDSITPGTNCAPVPEGGLNNLGSTLVSNLGAVVYKVGKQVYVWVRQNITATGSNVDVVSNLPIPASGFTWQMIGFVNNALKTYPAFYTLTNAGVLQCLVTDGTSAMSTGTFTATVMFSYLTA